MERSKTGFALKAQHFTDHVLRRMRQRAISREMVEAAMLYGREVIGPEVVMHVVGRREVRCWRMRGVRIEQLEGVHVLCGRDGRVITVYRNHELRGARALRRAS